MRVIEEKGLKSFGLVPDFGMFIERPTEIAIERYIGLGARRETLEWIIANRHGGMSEEEMLQLLATDGMLVKRPLLVGSDFVLVGFKEAQWAEQLGKL